MTLYCNPNWKLELQKQQLATFDQMWDCSINWIEEPNNNRGGWSGVGCIDVVFEEKSVTLFVKKQLNHTTRTFRHPIKGEPTFSKEFKVFQHLQAKDVVTPNVVFFAQRQTIAGQQAVLVTENLDGYCAFDEMTKRKTTMPLKQQRELLKCIAETVCRMHRSGMQHRSLYAKHIFVKPINQTFDVAIIDCEKARRMLFPLIQSVTDLITLNYRTLGWNNASRLHFFKCYFSIETMRKKNKFLARYIYKQTFKKLN